MRRFTYALLSLFALALPAYAQVDAETAVLRVSMPVGNGVCRSGSATCIACEGGRSLVLTNNHIFAPHVPPNQPTPRAAYPIDVEVWSVDWKRKWAGKAVDGVGDDGGDLALVVVETEMPCVTTAEADATPGTPIWHFGVSTRDYGGRRAGFVAAPTYSVSQPDNTFRGDIGSVSGDSGAGIFNGDHELVGVNSGRIGHPGTDQQRGATVGVIRGFLRTRVRGLFPNLSARVDAKRDGDARAMPVEATPAKATRPMPDATADPDYQRDAYDSLVRSLKPGERFTVYVCMTPPMHSTDRWVCWDNYPGVKGPAAVVIQMYTNGPHVVPAGVDMNLAVRSILTPPPAPTYRRSFQPFGGYFAGECAGSR